MDAAIDSVGTDEAIDTSLELVADRHRIATLAAAQRGLDSAFTHSAARRGSALEIRSRARLELARLADKGLVEVLVVATTLWRAAEVIGGWPRAARQDHPRPLSRRSSAQPYRRIGVGERQRVTSGSPFESTIGFSRALRVGDAYGCRGRTGVAGRHLVPMTPDAQARRCFEIILAALAEAGATPEDVVRTRMFLTSAADADAVSAVHGELFGDIRPAATMVVIAGLLDPRWKVEIEAEALIRPPP